MVHYFRSIFGFSLYLITSSSAALSDQTSPSAASAVHALPYPDAPRATITLKRDTRQRIGKLDIIDRGIEDRKLRLDVFVRNLDPEYAYRHAIAPDKASQGFRLGGIKLELLSAWNSRAKIAWHRKG